jgi:hypothetical protein
LLYLPNFLPLLLFSGLYLNVHLAATSCLVSLFSNPVLHSSQFFMLCSSISSSWQLFLHEKSHMVVLCHYQLCKATKQTFDTLCEDCLPTPSLKKNCENLKTYFLLADNFHLQFSYNIFLE